MCRLKQIGFFSIFFLLLACDESTTKTTTVPVGQAPLVTASGVATLAQDHTNVGVNNLQIHIYGTGGKSPADNYTGSAHFQGTIAFSSTYICQAYPPQTYVQHAQLNPQYQCPSTGVPYKFNCKACITNSNFTCPMSLHGKQYTIQGMFHPSKTVTFNYEIQGAIVLPPGSPQALTCPQLF